MTTATTKTAMNNTKDGSFRTTFCLKRKSTANHMARATNSRIPINLRVNVFISFTHCFYNQTDQNLIICRLKIADNHVAILFFML